MEKRNEPLLLRPAGKDYLWGGKRLNDEYGKNIELSPLAETWECSTHPDGVSTVRCGTFDKMELTAVIKAHPEYLGERHKGETTLPILVKLIDARKDLSVQVHPDDDYAKMKEHGQLGKTEMSVSVIHPVISVWYPQDSCSLLMSTQEQLFFKNIS